MRGGERERERELQNETQNKGRRERESAENEKQRGIESKRIYKKERVREGELVMLYIVTCIISPVDHI